MRVLVTGGSGFLGSHIVRALNESGHVPTVLVRNVEKARAALSGAELATDAVKHGDITDGRAVRAALADCEAVVHCANVFSLKGSDRHLMIDVNGTGTEEVLTAAAELGIDPAVHISSYVALLPAAGPIGPDSPVGEPVAAYAASKALAEKVARRHQAAGESVVAVYPGIVWGPDDPSISESSQMIIKAMRGKYRLLNKGYAPVVDVRDLAAAVAAMIDPGRGPRRYMVAGHDQEFRSLIAAVGQAAGKNLWSIRVPGAVGMVAGRVADALRGKLGLDPALSFEQPWTTANGQPTDSSRAADELGYKPRPLDETIGDTVAWLRSQGHI